MAGTGTDLPGSPASDASPDTTISDAVATPGPLTPPPPPGAVYHLDGRGGIADGLRPAAARGFSLIVLQPEPASCQAWLASEFGRVTADALLEADPRPHCTIYDEGALLALTVVPVADRAELSRQREAVFWMEKSRIVVVTDMSIDELLGSTPGKGGTSAPTTPVHLVMRAALRAADRLEPLDGVLRQPTERARVELNAVRRSAIMLRRTVLPQRDALTTLETSAYAWFTQRDRSRLREAVGWMNRLAAEIGSFTERAALVHEQIMDRRAETLNRSLLILAAVTTIFMPLTLITGLIGMNVAGIPFSGEPWAFAVIIAVLVVIGVLEFLWFRSRKWL